MPRSDMFKVLSPIEKDGKTFWLKLGVGFLNRDGSHNLYLDALPTNGKLHMRPWEDYDASKPQPNSSGDVPF